MDTKWKKESKLYQKHGKVTLGNQERRQGIAQQEEVRAFRVLWIWPRQRPGIHSKTMLTLKPGEQTGQEGLAQRQTEERNQAYIWAWNFKFNG